MNTNRLHVPAPENILFEARYPSVSNSNSRVQMQLSTRPLDAKHTRPGPSLTRETKCLTRKIRSSVMLVAGMLAQRLSALTPPKRLAQPLLLSRNSRATKMKLSILIPCFNERETINEICRALKLVHISRKRSSSSTITQPMEHATFSANDLHATPERIIFHEKNQGKGAALKTGIAAATGDIIITQDSDLEYDPSEIPRVIEPIIAGRADVVYGSRFIGGEAHRILVFWHRIGNGFLRLLMSNMLSRP